MPKDFKTYTLFIAAPGDIVEEKFIIRDLVDEWNRLQGNYKHVRIDVTDWSETYPAYGNRPQAIINEQIFDESDFVVSLFWTKFGSPTGIADSGTEEEILRAIDSGKHLLLYFSNRPISPAKMSSTDYEKISAFRKKHQDNGLYKVYESPDDFRKMFQINLSNFMNDLLSEKIKQPSTPKKPEKVTTEEDQTGASYEQFKDIEKKIKVNFPSYWTKLYGIIETRSAISGNITVSKDNKNKQEVQRLKNKVADWEKEITEYSSKLKDVFLKIDEIPADELKNEVMPEELWTVGSALSSYDNELWLFKQHYEEMSAYKVKETVEHIIGAIKSYQSKLPAPVSSNKVIKPASLGFDVLVPDETLRKGVIGKGIRSEILHKLAPEYFSLMTRRSIWALFFFSDEASEFVVDQTKEGKFRTVHNWDYLYDYFTYYNHVVFELMKQNLEKHKITLKPELKYGYVNLFLVDIFKSHAKDIEDLRKLKKV